MDALTISAASGMRARIESLDMLANNIANAGTPGFKSDRESYSLYISPEALAAAGEPPSMLPVIEGRWTDFSQGTLTPTGNPLQLGLAGEGFFAVQGPDGPLYTRSGDFRVSKSGELWTQEGYAVRGEAGRPVRIDPLRPVEVTADGSVRQGGEAVGRLELAAFTRPEALAKLGNGYFRPSGTGAGARPATAVEVRQGRVETSNMGAAEAAVRLTSVLRQFEMLQRAVTLGGEMNRKAVEEVARVS